MSFVTASSPARSLFDMEASLRKIYMHMDYDLICGGNLLKVTKSSLNDYISSIPKIESLLVPGEPTIEYLNVLSKEVINLIIDLLQILKDLFENDLCLKSLNANDIIVWLDHRCTPKLIETVSFVEANEHMVDLNLLWLGQILRNIVFHGCDLPLEVVDFLNLFMVNGSANKELIYVNSAIIDLEAKNDLFCAVHDSFFKIIKKIAKNPSDANDILKDLIFPITWDPDVRSNAYLNQCYEGRDIGKGGKKKGKGAEGNNFTNQTGEPSASVVQDIAKEGKNKRNGQPIASDAAGGTGTEAAIQSSQSNTSAESNGGLPTRQESRVHLNTYTGTVQRTKLGRTSQPTQLWMPKKVQSATQHEQASTAIEVQASPTGSAASPVSNGSKKTCNLPGSKAKSAAKTNCNLPGTKLEKENGSKGASAQPTKQWIPKSIQSATQHEQASPAGFAASPVSNVAKEPCNLTSPNGPAAKTNCSLQGTESEKEPQVSANGSEAASTSKQFYNRPKSKPEKEVLKYYRNSIQHGLDYAVKDGLLMYNRRGLAIMLLFRFPRLLSSALAAIHKRGYLKSIEGLPKLLR